MNGDDRMMSWLPFYHDMGLVGFMLVPMAAQVSIDYLDTREFAMRPRQWLELMTQSRATISFAPSFGHDLCARRVRPNDLANYDLSNWRVAGIGAEMIRPPDTLAYFAELLEPCGFDRRAFLACYGMAECTSGQLRPCGPVLPPTTSTATSWRTITGPCCSEKATAPGRGATSSIAACPCRNSKSRFAMAMRRCWTTGTAASSTCAAPA